MPKISNNPISVADWGIINADMSIANNAMKKENDLAMLNMAGYHYAQAIEKTLKGLVKANNERSRCFGTHDLCFIVVETELCCPGFIQKFPYIAHNATELSSANGIRYGNKTIRKMDLNILAKEAQTLVNVVETELINATGFSKDKLKREAGIAIKKEASSLSFDNNIPNPNTEEKPNVPFKEKPKNKLNNKQNKQKKSDREL